MRPLPVQVILDPPVLDPPLFGISVVTETTPFAVRISRHRPTYCNGHLIQQGHPSIMAGHFYFQVSSRIMVNIMVGPPAHREKFLSNITIVKVTIFLDHNLEICSITIYSACSI